MSKVTTNNCSCVIIRISSGCNRYTNLETVEKIIINLKSYTRKKNCNRGNDKDG